VLTEETVDDKFSALALQMEELETLDAPWSWGDFSAGVGVGFGGAGLVAAGIAIT
jgi:hypothetical protein